MSTQIHGLNPNGSVLPRLAESAPGHELPESLAAVVGRLEDAPEAGLVRHCFSTLTGLLADLRDASAGDSVDEFGRAPSVITSVGAGAFALIEHVEDASAVCEGMRQDVEEALIGVCFALRHEVRRAVEMNLSKQEGGEEPGAYQGRVAQAYNLLCNCFQQCVGLLARSIDPGFDESDLFDDTRLRLEQSLRLRDALFSLIGSVKDAEGVRYPQSAVSLFEEVEGFRRDHMRHLMRRDWETFDDFVNEVISAREQKAFTGAAKKFLAYLETLLAHVQMREVLKDQPAVASAPAPAPKQPEARAEGGRFTWALRKPAAWAAAAASVLLACGLLFSSRLNAEGGMTTATAVSAGHVEAAGGAGPVNSAEVLKTSAQETSAGERQDVKRTDARAVARTEDAGGDLTIQVGAYSDAASAASAVAGLTAKGVDARVSKGSAPRQGVVYRVQVGRFNSRAEASRVGGQLKAKGAVSTYLIAESE